LRNIRREYNICIIMIKIHEDMEENYYTIKEVASLLKVAYLTVYRWIISGKLEAQKAGKQYRISKTNLDKFMQKK